MTITNKCDLIYPIKILDKNGNNIYINECNEFVGKFFTRDRNVQAVCTYQNNEYTNIDTDNNGIINSSDLSLMANGVLHFEYSYSIEDKSFDDGYYNNVSAGDTNYFIKLNNDTPDTGGTGETQNVIWGDINGNINNQTDLIQKFNSKVDKIENKGLSTNDYTNEDKNKLASLNNYDDITIKSDISNIQSSLETKANSIDVYSKKEVDKKIDEINIPSTDLSNYYTKTEVYNKTEVDEKFENIQTGGTTDLSNYYNKQETDKLINDIPSYNDSELKSLINNKVDKVNNKSLVDNSEIERLKSLKNYDDSTINKNITDIQSSLETKANSSNVYSKSEVDKKINDIPSTDLSGYYNKVETDNLLSIKTNTTDVYLKKEVDDKISAIDIPVVDITKSYVDTELLKKQDILKAGTNITITDNTISSIDTVYDDTSIKNSLNNKVDKVAGKSLILDSEITRLSSVVNYDDSSLRTIVNSKANSSDVYNKTMSDSIYMKAGSIVVSNQEPSADSDAIIWFQI